MIPVQPFVPVDNTRPGQGDKNYLFDALIATILEHPLEWRLIITIGQPGDPTADATTPWPRVDVGTLTLDRIESEETSPARDLNFDSLVLPAGIVPSDDPLLSARSAFFRNPLPDARVSGKSPVRSPPPRCKTERIQGDAAAAIPTAHAFFLTG